METTPDDDQNTVTGPPIPIHIEIDPLETGIGDTPDAGGGTD